MNYVIAIVLLVLLGLLTLVSYVDRLYTEIGKFLSREFQVNIDAFEHGVEPRLGVSRERAAILKLAVWGGLDLPLRQGLELEHRLWKRGSAL